MRAIEVVIDIIGGILQFVIWVTQGSQRGIGYHRMLSGLESTRS